jgi:predicted nucleic acid-binding protein
MKNVLVDSNVLIAIYDINDSLRHRAVDDLSRFEQNKVNIWITEHILSEVLTILSNRGLKQQIEDIINKIENAQLHIYYPDNAQTAWKINKKVAQKLVLQQKTRASYTDLHQLVLVEDGFLTDSANHSYDHHLNHAD